MMPSEWKEILPEYANWFGVPLLLRKSLYGDRVANKAWDETQSEWLTSPDIGFSHLYSEGSIYMKMKEKDTMILLNAVDDMLYFSTSDDMRKWFEASVSSRFSVELMGQAHWYLQSRITQHADYSITLDQSRYALLVTDRYIARPATEEIAAKQREKYDAPLPYDAVFTKADSSETYLQVKELEAEFGFSFASAVGSLIYAMNTFIKLQYPIRKLARFMHLPGRKHFEYLKHLLLYLQSHPTCCGIKFYADPSKSPLHAHLKRNGLGEACHYPIIAASDSSFQDCPDTSRSTGRFVIMIQGGVVDAASIVPTLVSNSTCEAEYCTAAMCAMAISFVRKLFNELLCRDTDAVLTVPLCLDSKSAIDTASSKRETGRTRHISRRMHYIRHAVATGQITCHKISGEENWSNGLTKPLPAKQLDHEALVYQVDVQP